MQTQQCSTSEHLKCHIKILTFNPIQNQLFILFPSLQLHISIYYDKNNSKDGDNLHMLTTMKGFSTTPSLLERNFPQSQYSMIYIKVYEEGLYLRRSRHRSLAQRWACSEMSSVLGTSDTSVMGVVPLVWVGSPLPDAPSNIASCCSFSRVARSLSNLWDLTSFLLYLLCFEYWVKLSVLCKVMSLMLPLYVFRDRYFSPNFICGLN